MEDGPAGKVWCSGFVIMGLGFGVHSTGSGSGLVFGFRDKELRIRDWGLGAGERYVRVKG